VTHFGLHLPVTPQAYVPHAQPPWRMPSMTVVVRADAERDPLSLVSTVREHVRSIDPLQPVTRIQTFDDIVAQSMATRRFTLVLLASFAGTAVLLAIGRSVRGGELHRQSAGPRYRRSYGARRQRAHDHRSRNAAGDDTGLRRPRRWACLPVWRSAASSSPCCSASRPAIS
jgi:hypothetical protein